MAERNRYIKYKNGVKIDLVWKPYTLQKLYKAGMKDNFFTYREIMDVLGESDTNRQRLKYLRNSGWVIAKRRKDNSKYLAYTLSSRARKYLKRYFAFDNQTAPLFNRLRKPIGVATMTFSNKKEDAKIIKELETKTEKAEPEIIEKKVIEKSPVTIKEVKEVDW